MEREETKAIALPWTLPPSPKTSFACQPLLLTAIMARSGEPQVVKRQTILAGAGIMMVATLLSRLLGLVRDRAIAHFWGKSVHTDAYWAAFGVPDLLYYLLAGGAVSAAVIPVFAGYLRRNEEQESWHVANTLLTVFTTLAAVGVALIMVFAPSLVMLVAPGFIKKVGPGAVEECAGYVRILAPMVVFTVASAFFTGILQAHRHFTAPAMSWLVYNFGVIGGAFVGGLLVNREPGDPTGLRTLATGVIVGAALLALVQLPSLLARGFRFRPSFDVRHPGVREVLGLFLPYMAGLAFTQICLLWLPSLFGSYFPEGGVTSLRYANRLVILPLGLFGVAISTAAFPAMAERVANGEMSEFRRLISGTLRTVLFLSVPSAVGLFVLAGPVLRLLWKGGEFGETAVQAASFCLLFYAFSLIGLAGLQILNRAFYSLRDRLVPPLVGAGYNVVIVAVAIALMNSPLQYAAIAAATSLGSVIGFVVLFELLRRRLGGMAGRTIVLSFLRVSLASIALGLVALVVMQWSGRVLGVPVTHYSWVAPAVSGTSAAQDVSTLRVLMQVALSMAAGIAAYLLALRLLRAPEMESFRRALRQRREKSAVPN